SAFFPRRFSGRSATAASKVVCAWLPFNRFRRCERRLSSFLSSINLPLLILAKDLCISLHQPPASRPGKPVKSRARHDARAGCPYGPRRKFHPLGCCGKTSAGGLPDAPWFPVYCEQTPPEAPPDAATPAIPWTALFRRRSFAAVQKTRSGQKSCHHRYGTERPIPIPPMAGLSLPPNGPPGARFQEAGPVPASVFPPGRGLLPHFRNPDLSMLGPAPPRARATTNCPPYRSNPVRASLRLRIPHPCSP